MKLALSVVLLSFPWTVFAQQPITVQGRQFENVQALHDSLTQRPAVAGSDSTGQEQDLRAAALLEYAKLDSKGAREIALAEMANSSPDVAVEGLLFLEERRFPS